MLTIKNIFLFVFTISLISCEMDLANPNAATEQDVKNTKDGLFALAIGIRQVYSVTALQPTIFTPSITTRETAAVTTFANLEQLEFGGSTLSGENGYVNRMFNGLMRAKGMSEDLIESVPNVDLAEGTVSGLTAYGHLFRAMCLGYLSHNYTHVALENSLNNDAVFVERDVALQEAVSLLSSAVSLLETTPPSDDFTTNVNPNIDLLNTCRLFLARYQLSLGLNSEAIATANSINQSSASFFTYDAQNQNPVFDGFFEGTVEYAPRDNFGLPGSLAPDANDQRIDFFLSASDATSLSNFPIEIIAAPFSATAEVALPVYRPGEVELIKAEAYARQNDISNAEAALNKVRKKTAAQSPIGLGAGLNNNYTSNGNQTALLNEIYKNRRIELYMTGLSLEDSRRFNRPEPPLQSDLSTERNRNFYPFPLDERQNNENTPANPEI